MQNRDKVNINYLRIATIILLICTAEMIYGCASGTGVNRRQFFDNNAFTPLPFKVSIDNSIDNLETSAAVQKENVVVATAMFGVGGALGGSQGYVDFLRGKFQAGKAIEESITALGIQNDSKYLIHLHLKNCQYRIIPKTFQMEMDIYSRLDCGENINRFLYKCDMMPRSLMFTPGVEKDMQREIVEAIISHWGNQYRVEKSTTNNIMSPTPNRGEFSGKDAKCIYEIFGAP